MAQMTPVQAAQLLGKLRRQGPEFLSAAERRALRKDYLPEISAALEAYRRSLSPPVFSPSVRAPRGVSSADWLISLKPEFSQSKVALWGERHDSATLKLVSKLCALCPEIALSPWAFFDKPSHDEPSLLERIFRGADWTIELKTIPLTTISGIDRRASMLGGWPWTSEQYPWPLGEAGRMSPLLQLNLQQLELSLLEDFPPVIVQAWGNGVEFFMRTIRIEDISNSDPDPVFSGHNQKSLYYDGAKVGRVGELLATGKSVFHLCGHWLSGALSDGFSDRIDKVLGFDRSEKARDLIDALWDRVDADEELLPPFADRSHFGGYQSGMYDAPTLRPNGKRSLLEINEAESLIFKDGISQFIQVHYRSENIDREFDCIEICGFG